jgi:hypothetical protein
MRWKPWRCEQENTPMIRHCLPALSLTVLCSCAWAADVGTTFKAEIKQTEAMRLDWVSRIVADGPSLLVVSHRDGDINCFRRDTKTGGVTFLNAIDLNKDLGNEKRHLDAYPALSKKGIIYASGAWTHARGNQHSIGLSWYQYDARDGSTKRLGHVKCDAGALHPSAHDGLLYLQAWFSKAVYEVRIDPKTGTPAIGKKLTGKGVGGAFVLSPDGKHFYSMSKSAVGWGTVAADGSLTHTGSASLSVLDPKGGIRSRTLAVSPDGRFAYINLNGYGLKNDKGRYTGYNALGLFNRNAETGALTFVKTIKVDANMQKITHIEFRSDGTAGYYSSGPESSGDCMGWFTRDPKTGELTFGGVAANSKRCGPGHFAFARATGTIYMAGTWRTKSFRIYAVPPDVTK